MTQKIPQSKIYKELNDLYNNPKKKFLELLIIFFEEKHQIRKTKILHQ